MKFTYYDFFAGGGMVQEGLGKNWVCTFANDIDKKKAASYAANWGDREFHLKDVAEISIDELPPGGADLSWASFPCQDLSLAGNRSGLSGHRSGTFWPYWSLMKELVEDNRSPKIIVLENVYGALRSHGGEDFATIASAFSKIGYRFGPLVIDAANFVPQSRPRLFIIGFRSDIEIPETIANENIDRRWHPKAVKDAFGNISLGAKKHWLWIQLPHPTRKICSFADLLEENPSSVPWHSQQETYRLLSMMTDTNIAKVSAAQAAGKRIVGGLYRRTRNGVQRAEVRFDDLSGCIRTPTGGSSRQTLLIVEGEKLKSRLLSPREAARLMGLSNRYKLPTKYNDAYHLAGDGVVVDVVRHLSDHVFEPVLKQNQFAKNAA